MRKAVRDAWLAFNEPFEGRVRFMYLDVKGLVTTGVGNLVDPMSHALSLPWRRGDGTLASDAEVAAEWRNVKRSVHLAPKGGGHFGAITALRLSDADVDTLVSRKLFDMAGALRAQFPAFDTWPAPAQLALLSVSWARGPHAYAKAFPKLTAALVAEDFATAARECRLSGGGTIRDRNARNHDLFLSAAKVVADGLDRDALVAVPRDLPVRGDPIRGAIRKAIEDDDDTPPDDVA